MAARTTMATLIAQVRDLIADPSGSSQVFTDLQIQDALDARREDVRTLPLRPAPGYAAGGALQYLHYYADGGGGWESAALLQDSAYATLTPSSEEPLVGHWVLAASTPPPAYATGSLYDLNGAAGDLLVRWAAQEKLSFDFDGPSHSFKRSQKVAMLTAMARDYHARSRPQTVPMVRDDMTAGVWTGPTTRNWG